MPAHSGGSSVVSGSTGCSTAVALQARPRSACLPRNPSLARAAQHLDKLLVVLRGDETDSPSPQQTPRFLRNLSFEGSHVPQRPWLPRCGKDEALECTTQIEPPMGNFFDTDAHAGHSSLQLKPFDVETKKLIAKKDVELRRAAEELRRVQALLRRRDDELSEERRQNAQQKEQASAKLKKQAADVADLLESLTEARALIQTQSCELSEMKLRLTRSMGDAGTARTSIVGDGGSLTCNTETEQEALRDVVKEAMWNAEFVTLGGVNQTQADFPCAQKEMGVRSERAELQDMKARALLQERGNEVAALRARASPCPSSEGASGAASSCSVTLTKTTCGASLESEISTLRAELQQRKRATEALEREIEQQSESYARFFGEIAVTSSKPTVEAMLELSTAEVLGMGSYGFVLLCQRKASGQPVVMKLQSPRWLNVAVREWNHSVNIGQHPNIVKHEELLMHLDSAKSLTPVLVAAFDEGTLTGARPSRFPDSYLCMLIEYMDRGTIQNLVEGRLLTTAGALAVTQQVSSALAFMHQHKRSHNDLKADNVLLRSTRRKEVLVVKLADFGFAEHDTGDHRLDHERLAYMVLYMSMDKPFTECPANDEDWRKAIRDFRRSLTSNYSSYEANVLVDVAAGLWARSLRVQAVAEMPQLRGHEVRVPETSARVLEVSAKREVERRCSAPCHHPRSDDAVRLASRRSSSGKGLAAAINLARQSKVDPFGQVRPRWLPHD
eukprot:TRINITY_DN38157_c0_g1_i1.p1 TRINITY_DN38157_c0_g1~~TRINITY_DN38157_c0_g1_i1.p1  ORF type:complete len:759 (-),score=144.39 TRINITY_DN38157_c0_g1_i1:21-2207(-)